MTELYWVLGFFFSMIAGSYGFSFLILMALNELKVYTHSLPCASNDVEGRLDALEARMDYYDKFEIKDAMGFTHRRQ
jgi:hypothetical protein